MKKIILITSVLLILISCGEKIYFKEVISNKKVTLSMRENYKEKYLTINIPLEFELNLNSDEVKDVGFYWILNNKQLTPIEDYVVMNSLNNKIIYAIEDIDYPNFPKRVYLYNRRNEISNEKALELIQKYNPKASIESIKTRNDTILLVSYFQYRKDYPEFIKEMKKVPDSLILSLGLSGGKSKIIKEKINW